MKILVATPLYPPDIGGPATYARGLEEELKNRGIETIVASFHRVRHLPKGISHLVYTIQLLYAARGADAMIVLDPVSVGIPAVCAQLFRGVPLLVRIGGDTLWERYVARTKKMIPLSRFYLECLGELSVKERSMYRLIKFFLQRAQWVCFSTGWQRDLWQTPYELLPQKIHVVENAFPAVRPEAFSADKRTFLWAGREIFLKNTQMLQDVFEKVKMRHPDIALEMVTGVSHEQLHHHIKDAYALVLPSLTDISPNFILEGLGKGKPFILTKETGISGGIMSCGEFVDPTNSEDLLRAFERMLDPRIYEEYRARIRSLEQSRSYESIVSELLDLMKTAI